MYTDVSIDLETLGVEPGSVITQIGLCVFDSRHRYGNTVATMIEVNPQDAMNQGQKVNWSTIAWWLQQDEAPRVRMARQEGYPLLVAVAMAADFIHQHCGQDKALYRVWGHGSGFDCTQLEIAYNLMKQPVPWDFRNVRDLRTLLAMAPPVLRPVPTEAHNAMADAVAQAKWIQELVHHVLPPAPPSQG